ncbi:hypothetical protein DW228_06490 [Bacteroides fragilis]|uniref:Uncharacterized protein n=1 Tax=Bacteroides fragilis TaxID=817 RepID=A0A396C1R9_BACFG|nr:hypothetical protein [Bacteroides fragilis]RHH14445.1 hypothetical protein DW228_06490 [Bacteroides fragilis]
MMVTLTVIFGEEAVKRYEETNKLPSRQWLQIHGGYVGDKTFSTESECQAYVDALEESDNYFDWRTLKPVITLDVPRDCPYCEEWRTFFADRVRTVYCPDCGQIILNPDKQNSQCETKNEYHKKNTP